MDVVTQLLKWSIAQGSERCRLEQAIKEQSESHEMRKWGIGQGVGYRLPRWVSKQGGERYRVTEWAIKQRSERYRLFEWDVKQKSERYRVLKWDIKQKTYGGRLLKWAIKQKSERFRVPVRFTERERYRLLGWAIKQKSEGHPVAVGVEPPVAPLHPGQPSQCEGTVMQE